MSKPSKSIPTDEQRLLTADQVAKCLAISRRSVFRFSDAGQIPAPIKLGRSIRWNRQQIEEWLAKAGSN